MRSINIQNLQLMPLFCVWCCCAPVESTDQGSVVHSASMAVVHYHQAALRSKLRATQDIARPVSLNIAFVQWGLGHDKHTHTHTHTHTQIKHTHTHTHTHSVQHCHCKGNLTFPIALCKRFLPLKLSWSNSQKLKEWNKLKKCLC